MFIPTNQVKIICMPHKNFQEITGYFPENHRNIGKYRRISILIGKILPTEKVQFPSLVGINSRMSSF